MLFLAICRSQFPLSIILASSWHQKTKLALWTSWWNKKQSFELKDLLKKKWLIEEKITCYIKQSPNFLSFSFLIDYCMSIFFSFLIKAYVNLEKMINFVGKFSLKWRKLENTEGNVSPKTLVSNVLLAFLDQWKPKIFFVGQPWWPT